MKRYNILKALVILTVMMASVFVLTSFDADESDSASYSWTVGINVDHVAVATGRLDVYNDNYSITGSVPGVSFTTSTNGNNYILVANGTPSTAGSYTVYWKWNGTTEATISVTVSGSSTPTYTVSFSASPSSYGSVSSSSITVSSGTTYQQLTGSNYRTLRFSDGQEVTAVPHSSTASTTYSFSSWSSSSGTITANKSITANFTSNTRSYTVFFTVDDSTHGSVSRSSITAPYGSTMSVSGNSITLNGTTVTASGSTGYDFSSWSNTSGSITSTRTVTANFTLKTFTVSFTAGTGGSVDRSSIASVPYGSAITVSDNTVTINGTTVTATASTGYTFGSWSNTSGTITSARTITANFTPYTYTVSFTAGTGGSVDKNSITSVPYGSTITVSDNTVTINGTTVTATASTGYAFSSWSNTSGTITANRTITASFAPNSFTVTILSDDTNSGTVSSGSIANVPYGSSITVLSNTITINGTTVTATPTAGHQFYGWSNASGTITANRTIIANFTNNTYTVSFTAGTGGAVSGNSITNVPYDSAILISENTITINGTTITATPNSGKVFSNWSNASGTITADRTITANFANSTLTVTFSAGTGGTVSSNTLNNIPYGSSVAISGNTITINGNTITATPSQGYFFGSWSVSDGDVLTANTTITASFITSQYSMTWNVGTPVNFVQVVEGRSDVYNDDYTISGSVPGITFTTQTNGSNYALYANGTPTTVGQYTIQWYYGDTLDAVIQVSVQNNVTTYTVTFASNNSGYGNVTPSTLTVASGTTYEQLTGSSYRTIRFSDGQEATAVPNASTQSATYSFSGWSSTSGTISGNTTITANFTTTARDYDVFFNVDDSTHGSVSRSKISVPYGSTIAVNGNKVTINGTTVTATPATGYSFSSWTNTTGTVTSVRTITANFTLNTYTVTISAGSGGSVDTSTIASVPYGSAITVSNDTVTINGTTVTATPNSGYFFVDWTNASGTVTSNRTITANFTADVFTVSFGVNNGNYGSVNRSSIINVPYGSAITVSDNSVTIAGTTVTATASAGYYFSNWSNTSGTVTSNRTITANFTADVFTVSFDVNNSDFGTIDRNSIANVPYGSSITVTNNTITIAGTTVTATPNSGYVFADWINSSGTITSNRVITANFSGDSYIVSFDVNNPNYGTINRNSILNVPYGSAITVSNNTITIAGTTVTATPMAGYYFGNWSNVAGTITADRTITANFVSDTISVSFTAGIGGSVSSSTLNNVPYGSTVSVSGNTVSINGSTVTATPSSGYYFSSWSVANGDTLTSDTTITASFVTSEYTMSWSVNLPVNNVQVVEGRNDVYDNLYTTSGTVPGITFTTQTNGSNYALYANGTPTTAGQYTVKWYYGDTLDAVILVIVQNNVTTYTVTFATNNANYGSVTPSTLTVASGTTYEQLTGSSYRTLRFSDGQEATAVYNASTQSATYSFSSWSSTSGTITNNTTITANFTTDVREYNVFFNVDDPAHGTVSASKIIVPYGSSITVSNNTVSINGRMIQATPSTGYTFSSWTNASGTVTSTRTITANFTINTYTVTVEAGSGGTVDSGTILNVPYGSAIAVSNDTVTINGTTVTATPNSGYFFVDWTNASGTVTSNRTITANFTADVFTVSFGVNNSSQGSVNRSTITNIPYGSVITVNDNSITINGTTVTATPAYGYYFSNWSNVNDTITSNRTITANFTANVYTVSIVSNNDEYGTVSETVLEQVPYGSVINVSSNTITIAGTTVTATPNSGYTFLEWSNSDGQILANRIITAVFSGDSFTVTFNAEAGGTVSNDSIINVPYGSAIMVSNNTVTINGTTVTATPDSGHYFSNWSNVNDTITANRTITANFTTDRYTVSFSAQVGGSVSSSTINNVPYGTIVSVSDNTITISGSTVTATPDSGYYFSGWSVADGTAISGTTAISARFITSDYSMTWTVGLPVQFVQVIEGRNDVYDNDYSISGSVPGMNFFTQTNGSNYALYANGTPTTVGQYTVKWYYGDNLDAVAIFYVQPSTATYTVTFDTNNSDYGTVTPSALIVASGTTYQQLTGSNSRTIRFSDGQEATAVYNASSESVSYRFVSWSSTSGTITNNTTITANFTTTAREYTILFTVDDPAHGTVSRHMVDAPYGSIISVSGNTVTLNGTQVVANSLPGYTFSNWSNTSGAITSTRTVTANFTTNTYTLSFVSNNQTFGTVSPTSIQGVPHGSTIEVDYDKITINGVSVRATANQGYYFSNWTAKNGDTVTSATTYTARFIDPTLIGWTEGVQLDFEPVIVGMSDVYDDLYTVSGAVPGITFYTQTDGERYVLYADGVPDTTGTYAVSWLYDNELKAVLSITVNEPNRYTVSFVSNNGTWGQVTPVAVNNVLDGTVIKVDNNIIRIGDATIVASAYSGYYFGGWTAKDGDVISSNITYTARFVEPSSLNLVVGVEEDFQMIKVGRNDVYDDLYSISGGVPGMSFFTQTNGERYALYMNGTPTVPGQYTVLWKYDGFVEDAINVTVVYNASSVWWYNGYVNGSANIAFNYGDSMNVKSHTLTIPLLEYDGIKKEGENSYFRFTEYYLQITLSFPRVTADIELYEGSELVKQKTYILGTWPQFSMTIDAQNSTITFYGIGKNINESFSFIDYTTSYSESAFDYSDVVKGLAFSRIYHSDSAEHQSHINFQVMSTSTYLDTYGFVMIDPSLNIYTKFPMYNDLRLNLYSFALYGESITINGHTLDLDMSSIENLYVIEHKDPVYKQVAKERAVGKDPETGQWIYETYYVDVLTGYNEYLTIANATDPGAKQLKLTLDNVYITWENINTYDADNPRECYLTFVNDNIRIGMGSYDPASLDPNENMTVSATGMWYFTTAVWEPYESTEINYEMNWDSWFNLSANGFILIFAGVVIAILAIFTLALKWRLELMDWLVIIGAGVVSYVLLGAF